MSVTQILGGGLGTPFDCGEDGSTVRNLGPATVYYRDEAPVSVALNDGSLASGGSVTLYGTVWLFVASEAASVRVVRLPLAASRIEARNDYGAVGDGITDDTSALQAVINEASTTGRDAYIPAGTFMVSTLTLYDGTQIRGAGPGTVVKQIPGSTGIVMGPGVVADGLSDFLIADLVIDGNAANNPQPAGGGHGFQSYITRRARFERVEFRNLRSYGIGLEGYPTSTENKTGPEEDVLLLSCRFINCGNGRRTASTTTLDGGISSSDTSVTLTDASVLDQSGGTLEIDGEIMRHGVPAGDTVTVVRGIVGTTAAAHSDGDTVYRLNNADGIDIKSSLRVSMIDCYAERCGDKGFNPRGRFVMMVGCRAYQCVTGFDCNTAPGGSATPTSTRPSRLTSSPPRRRR